MAKIKSREIGSVKWVLLLGIATVVLIMAVAFVVYRQLTIDGPKLESDKESAKTTDTIEKEATSDDSFYNLKGLLNLRLRYPVAWSHSGFEDTLPNNLRSNIQLSPERYFPKLFRSGVWLSTYSNDDDKSLTVFVNNDIKGVVNTKKAPAKFFGGDAIRVTIDQSKIVGSEKAYQEIIYTDYGGVIVKIVGLDKDKDSYEKNREIFEKIINDIELRATAQEVKTNKEATANKKRQEEVKKKEDIASQEAQKIIAAKEAEKTKCLTNGGRTEHRSEWVNSLEFNGQAEYDVCIFSSLRECEIGEYNEGKCKDGDYMKWKVLNPIIPSSAISIGGGWAGVGINRDEQYIFADGVSSATISVHIRPPHSNKWVGSAGTTAFVSGKKIVLIKTGGAEISATQISGAEEDVAYTDNNGVATFRVSHQDSVTRRYHYYFTVDDSGSYYSSDRYWASVVFYTQDKIHTVQVGDTIASIGAQYGVSWERIADINKISYPYAMEPGKRLIVLK